MNQELTDLIQKKTEGAQTASAGEGGEATLLAQPGPRWSFLQARQPTLHAVPFDEHALAEVLGRVMRA